MPERVELWWARRQFSKGADVPYPVGTYRSAWAAYPALIRQYHPDLNAGITLTQIPPAADVLLLWQCEAGHAFAATPSEQRQRPGRERRRSEWCPECSGLAQPTRISPHQDGPAVPKPRQRPARALCAKTPDVPVGEPFVSTCAPKPASVVEGRLRADLFSRLTVTAGFNAIRTAWPFLDHVEVWPDILLAELRIAVEYDSVGKHGLEHVGRREDADRRPGGPGVRLGGRAPENRTAGADRSVRRAARLVVDARVRPSDRRVARGPRATARGGIPRLSP